MTIKRYNSGIQRAKGFLELAAASIRQLTLVGIVESRGGSSPNRFTAW